MRQISILFFLFWMCISHAQEEYAEQFQKQYEQNIKKEYINDIYIPENVSDAMRQLDQLSTASGRARLLETDESTASKRLVYGLGKWMSLNWNFYEGSRLSHHLKQLGVSRPDDMSKFLIVTYHRHLRNHPLEVKERAQSIFEQRKKEQERRNAGLKSSDKS